jgi:SAM-dependent methyltransferase
MFSVFLLLFFSFSLSQKISLKPLHTIHSFHVSTFPRALLTFLRKMSTFPSGEAPPMNFFRDVIYQEMKAKGSVVPWDVGKAQPALASVGEIFKGDILDVGTGTGDNARWISSLKGVSSVLAVDLAPSAIEIALSRGAGGPAPLKFSVGDVLESEKICPLASMDVLLDYAVFHCIGDDEQQRAYLRSVTPLVKPGGRLVLFNFSDENDAATWRGPRRIPPSHARALWEEAGWTVDSLRTDVYYLDTMGRNDGKGGHALLMTATRRQ